MLDTKAIRELHSDFVRFEGAIHGGTGTAITNCYSYQDGHHEFGEWLVNEFPALLDELEAAQEKNAQLVKEVTALAIESVKREKTLAGLESEVMAAVGSCGKWEKKPNGHYRCSECGQVEWEPQICKYCPYCGAKMEVEG